MKNIKSNWLEVLFVAVILIGTATLIGVKVSMETIPAWYNGGVIFILAVVILYAVRNAIHNWINTKNIFIPRYIKKPLSS